MPASRSTLGLLAVISAMLLVQLPIQAGAASRVRLDFYGEALCPYCESAGIAYACGPSIVQRCLHDLLSWK